jgi:small redox-active disulfide protein 2
MEAPMKVQILGSGCAKCKLLEQHAREAVTELGLGAEVVKVADIDAIVAMGVMSTPALAIDGVVKNSGRVLSKDQVVEILKSARA